MFIKLMAAGGEGCIVIVCSVLVICFILTNGCEAEVTFSRFYRNYSGEVNEQAVYI
jgi:hypothetical protein